MYFWCKCYLESYRGVDCLEGAMITVCGVYQPACDCPIIAAASRTNPVLEHRLNDHILGGGLQPIEDKDHAAIRGRIRRHFPSPSILSILSPPESDTSSCTASIQPFPVPGSSVYCGTAPCRGRVLMGASGQAS